ncbi:MAG: S24 family peptidase [Saprospiraceae bacterium]|nr:S24 family peptidase [Candidatus Opimibacter skivensis]
MSITSVTERFLTCLDQLVTDGKVRSKRHFALTVGYHAQGISEMLAHRRDAPLELIEKAVLVFRFNPVYLFTGHGNLFSNTAEDDGLRLMNLTVVTDQKGEERIVHVPYPAQAGYGRLLDDPVFLSDLPTYQLPDPQFRSGTYRSFEIAGASMEPVFMQGDIVISAFIEPRYWEQAIKNGQIYIIVTHQEVVIKRINNLIKTQKCIECCSVNTVYEPYTIAAEDIREVWKARVKLTTHIDELTPTFNTHAISEQLQVQQKMLETLHHHLTNSKAS